MLLSTAQRRLSALREKQNASLGGRTAFVPPSREAKCFSRRPNGGRSPSEGSKMLLSTAERRSFPLRGKQNASLDGRTAVVPPSREAKCFSRRPNGVRPPSERSKMLLSMAERRSSALREKQNTSLGGRTVAVSPHFSPKSLCHTHLSCHAHRNTSACFSR